MTTPRDYLAVAGVWEVLGLIVAEFKSDPTAVQCFDLRLVARACALVAEHEAGGAGRLVLIWSIEHDAWWKPGSLGYTRDVAEAGRDARPDRRRPADDRPRDRQRAAAAGGDAARAGRAG